MLIMWEAREHVAPRPISWCQKARGSRFYGKLMIFDPIFNYVIGILIVFMSHVCYAVSIIKVERVTIVRGHLAVLAPAATAALALLVPAPAGSFTFGELVAGQVKPTVAYGTGTWCLVDNGNTLFQISQNNTKAVISLAEVIYFDGTNYYQLSGQSILTFSDATSGTIHFKQTQTYPAPVHNPAYTNYTQTYNAATDQLIVTFNIGFPNCTLPIFAVFDAP